MSRRRPFNRIFRQNKKTSRRRHPGIQTTSKKISISRSEKTSWDNNKNWMPKRFSFPFSVFLANSQTGENRSMEISWLVKRLENHWAETHWVKVTAFCACRGLKCVFLMERNCSWTSSSPDIEKYNAMLRIF